LKEKKTNFYFLLKKNPQNLEESKFKKTKKRKERKPDILLFIADVKYQSISVYVN
jgi:hypothetical protein